MQKTMMEVSVRTQNGLIYLEQCGTPDEQIVHTIMLAPEQVDVLSKWLQEAKNEVE